MPTGFEERERAWIGRVLGIRIPEGAQAKGVATAADAGTSAAAAPAAAEPAPASGTVVFTKARLAWDGTRKQVRGELQKVEAAILEQCRGEPDYALIAGNSKLLYTVLDFLDERLIDTLDEALNAQTPVARRAKQDEAREIIDEYLDYLNADEFLSHVDDNGFVEVSIIATVTGQLNDMSRQLAA